MLLTFSGMYLMDYGPRAGYAPEEQQQQVYRQPVEVPQEDDSWTNEIIAISALISAIGGAVAVWIQWRKRKEKSN